MSQHDDRIMTTQMPPALPSQQLSDLNARFAYHPAHLPPSSVTEASRVPPEVPRKPIQRGYSLHNDNGRQAVPPADYAVVDRRAVHSVIDYPFHYDYHQHDRMGALPRSFSNHTSFNEHDKMTADPVTSARVRSKTPGPDFMRGVRPEVGGEGEMYSNRPSNRSKTPTFDSSNKTRSSVRNRPPMSGTPDFIPASQYTGPQDGLGHPGDPNWVSVSSHQALPKLSSSSVSSVLHGSPYTDSTAVMLGMKAPNPMNSWTESPSSNFSEPGRHVPARTLHEEQFYEMPIYLRRLETGFGFRIIGGTEEGSQVCSNLHFCCYCLFSHIITSATFSDKHNVMLWHSFVRPAVCPIFSNLNGACGTFSSSLNRVRGTWSIRLSRGSTQHGQCTFLSEYYEDGRTFHGLLVSAHCLLVASFPCLP